MFIVKTTKLGTMTFRPIKVSTQEDLSLSGVYISDFFWRKCILTFRVVLITLATLVTRQK
jgi:hypothetical protein